MIGKRNLDGTSRKCDGTSASTGSFAWDYSLSLLYYCNGYENYKLVNATTRGWPKQLNWVERVNNFGRNWNRLKPGPKNMLACASYYVTVNVYLNFSSFETIFSRIGKFDELEYTTEIRSLLKSVKVTLCDFSNPRKWPIDLF